MVKSNTTSMCTSAYGFRSRGGKPSFPINAQQIIQSVGTLKRLLSQTNQGLRQVLLRLRAYYGPNA